MTDACPRDVDGWWAVDALRPGVWRIAEPGHVASFLVEGERRATLVDTGMGIRPIRPVVESLTALPVLVVNTHHHFDHVGGNHEFAEIAIHEAGATRLAEGASLDLVGPYLGYARAMTEAFTGYEIADRAYFHQLTDDRRVRRLPDMLGEETWRIPVSEPTQLLRHGDVIDLGGRALGVRHAPGHSSDGIVLDVLGEGVLLGGDTVNTGTVYACTPDSDVRVLSASMDALAAEAERWDLVTCCHWLVTVVGPDMLIAQAEALRQVVAGTAPLLDARDCLGARVREARFDGFSILVPPST